LPGTLVPSPTLGVVDVSFISLRLVLPALVAQLARPADIVALIKPQFEVGREHVGKGGIVRDEAARSRAVADVVAAAAAAGLVHRATIPSPIEGADGNVEFLAWFHLPSVEG
jgi:23S rRNA (cytidine1920-2'-O)/16S rRNA (cytidine1409-2'-O)-methyltransferase